MSNSLGLLQSTMSRSPVLHRLSLLRPSTLVPCRFKGHLLPHRKPRWIPPAKSKVFVLPPPDHTPESENTLMNELVVNYNERLSGVTQYLYEDFLRFSDVGEVGRIEAAKEAEEHRARVAENDRENARIVEARKQRMAQELEDKKRRAQENLEAIQTADQARIRDLEERVQRETAILQNAVTKENLDAKIEEALANPVDHEYAIDTEGHIYYGRYTASNDVPENQRIKIPVPKNEMDFLTSDDDAQLEHES
ncbi:hypothetical protein TCAL_03197 [Tigriopus californicus]|uniref:Small ribosomal subunit protein mS26 n=1 Tax=Tigriopus californicus TaxID=6832 RepID=A0A553N6E2_TIGCA|nr:small ribosomal subunit protein mS26-like [Tigriopus californicus]TRY61004.1 hypothetical protein TCAL_03197 [Tigriopus californicus]|eukprot:TCALIF_03197-PA protein Name:"Similar to mRpS26 Probable 28S ribosomal protein S26, mitochondrial (Drosophila melanogaster)" AED:0.09 eAED:0.09 QI:128/1/1/1/1/1/2/40/250